MVHNGTHVVQDSAEARYSGVFAASLIEDHRQPKCPLTGVGGRTSSEVAAVV